MANNIVSRVIQLRQQGRNDNDIVRELQNEGLTSQQIFDAMSQADIYAQSQGQQQEQAMTQEAQEQPQGEMPPPPRENPPLAQEQTMPQQEPYEQPQGEQHGYGMDERIQAIAETIIDEKWEELISQMGKVVDWKEDKDKEIAAIKDNLEDLRQDFSELRKAVLGKVGEYDERMKDVGSELKAIEKVFKDVVPTFTENVNELARITSKLKKNKGKKK